MLHGQIGKWVALVWRINCNTFRSGAILNVLVHLYFCAVWFFDDDAKKKVFSLFLAFAFAFAFALTDTEHIAMGFASLPTPFDFGHFSTKFM